MTVHTLFELNEFIRRMFALNFPEAVWVRAEIGQVQVARGHCWLELVEKDEDTGDIIAQAGAVVWRLQLDELYDQLGSELDALLQVGMEIQARVRVEYHERYGLKLHVLDLDSDYTLGRLERARRRLIARLQQEGLLEKNKERPLPVVVQRLALISAPTAAGLQDFATHLSENEFGYAFRHELFPAAMQGVLTEKEVLARLSEIEARQRDFDCVVLLRGGGSRLDLAAFDSEALCRAVARFPLPVLTAIGHETDETVLDMVAHTRLKTPTAAADWLIRHNMHFEMEIQVLEERLREATRFLMQAQRDTLARLHRSLHLAVSHRLQREHLALDGLHQRARKATTWLLRTAARELDTLERQLALLRPEHTMRRGFTLTTLPDGRLLRSAREVEPGTPIRTHLPDGIVESRTTNAEKKD